MADIIRNVLTIIGAVPAIFFPVWYHWRLNWRASEMGRHVMAYSVVVAMAYASGLIRILAEDYPGQEAVRLTLNFLMIIVVWWRVIVFMHIRRAFQSSRTRRDPDSLIPEPEKKI